MKFRSIILVLLVLINRLTVASAQPGYDVYHQQINNAERCMFLQNNYDSARYYYDKTFSEFDFCFVKDCIVAAELAALYKDDSACYLYILKGFENGLKLADIRALDWYGWRVRVFDTFLNSYAITKRLEEEYAGRHYKYVHRIDSNLRRRMNEVYIFDQIGKICADVYPCREGYAYPEDKFTGLYDSLIKTVGYPGERLVGIDDVGLATELRMPGEELRKIFKRLKNSDSTLRQVPEADIHIYFKDFTAYTVRVPFIYNSCSYRKFQPYFLDQIKKGNIHPREIGAVYNQSGYGMRHSVCRYSDYARYSLGGDQESISAAAISASNAKRASIYICSNELDFAKRGFEQVHHIQIFFGAFMM